MNEKIIEVDGSILEGGGQIIRMAIALSALLSKRLRIVNVRGKRPKPGLQAQHLVGINLTSEMCNARVEGCKMQSTLVEFFPQRENRNVSDFTADTKTAGATTLLAQVSLPFMLLGRSSKTVLTLKGGTNADFAPQIEDYLEVFIPILKHFGADVKCSLIRKGYFPKGGGLVKLTANPVGELKPVNLVNFGEVKSIHITASVNGTLPVRVAQEMSDVAKDQLMEYFGKKSAPRITTNIFKEKEFAGSGNGSSLFILAETTTHCLLSSGGIGSRSNTPKEVGMKASQELLSSIQKKACLDVHHQDQVIIYMALANGTSLVRTGPLSLHTKTAIYIAELLTGAKFDVKESNTEPEVFIIECQGINYKNSL